VTPKQAGSTWNKAADTLQAVARVELAAHNVEENIKKNAELTIEQLRQTSQIDPILSYPIAFGP